MRTLLLLAMLLIAGCSGEVKGWELSYFEAQCKAHGGIDYIDTTLWNRAVCRDGTVTFPKRAQR